MNKPSLRKPFRLHNSPRQHGRNGVTLVVVLVLISVVTIIMLTALTSTLRQRRQLRMDLQLEQTKWIVDAGVRKSLLELKRNPDFKGQTIDLSSALPKYEVSTLAIKRVVSDKKKTGDTIEVNASIDFRKDTTRSTKRSHNYQIK